MAKHLPKWLSRRKDGVFEVDPDVIYPEFLKALGVDEIDRVADRDQLERGFRGLPVEQRAVLVLRHIIGLPLEEVARTLDIPAGTARSRLYRALTSMRATLEADIRTPETLETATQEVTP